MLFIIWLLYLDQGQPSASESWAVFEAPPPLTIPDSVSAAAAAASVHLKEVPLAVRTIKGTPKIIVFFSYNLLICVSAFRK